MVVNLIQRKLWEKKKSRIQSITVGEGAALWQKVCFGLFLPLFTYGTLNWSLVSTLGTVVAVLILVFAGIGVFKFTLAAKSGGIIDLPDKLLSDEECPTFTVVSALYNEPQVLPILIRNLDTMDYPRDKVRFLIILEEKDSKTWDKIHELGKLPENFEYVKIPASYCPDVKGKPRALNFTISQERSRGSLGELFVIYDAEDRPEKDQLRKAATAFAQMPDVACFQAELRWFNRYQNWFTRMLAGSYASGFRVLSEGLAATFGTLPLGGTSNHMRSEALTLVGDYDELNVTEDADLGAKFKRAGMKVMMLSSITWEEATTSFKSQVKQGSRWIKGYTATLIAHTKNPVAFVRDFKLWGSLSFLVIFGGTHISILCAPVFWAMTIYYFVTGSSFIQQITPSAVFHLGVACSIANVLYIWMMMLACLKTKQYRLIPWMLTIPIYWLTVLFGAAFKAAWEIALGQYATWDKTAHGIAFERRPEIMEPISIGRIAVN